MDDRMQSKWRVSAGVMRSVVIVAALVFGGLWPAAAQTQDQTTAPAVEGTSSGQAMTPEAIGKMASEMSEAEFRQYVIEKLGPPPAADTPAAVTATDPLRLTLDLFGSVGERVITAVTNLPEIAARVVTAANNFVDRLGWSGVAWFALGVVVAIGAGLLAEWLVNRLAARWKRVADAKSEDGSLGGTLRVLAVRFALDMVGLIAFLIVTRAVGRALIHVDARPVAALLLLYGVVVPRFVAALLRFALAPDRPALRLVSTDNWTASFLYRNLVGILVLVGLSLFLLNFMLINGVGVLRAGVGFWLNLAIFVWLGWVIYKARDGMVTMVRGLDDDATAWEERMARAYPWAALVVLGLAWLLFELMVVAGYGDLLEGGKQFLTLGILLLAPALDTMIRGLVRHLVPPIAGQGAVAEKAYASTKRSYVRIGRVLVFGFVIFVVAMIWDLGVTSFTSNELGQRFAARFFTFLIILATGYLLWEIATLLFNRQLARETTSDGDQPAEEPGESFGGAGATRLTTVLPLLRMTTQATIIVLTALVALSNLGIDITALVAGAGILGLAIGFGAQTLVKDIVSGIFFLIDDAFRVGEYIVVGSTVGTVEKISVRSLQLRHHEGPVHTIPYGEIGQVTNNSRDWVIVKMKFTVPFDTDVNKIKKIFKKIGADILEEPYAEDIIQTFKSQGVASVDDVGIVVRGKFMSKPGKQWVIRKDIYSRVQKEFAANGIQFARREVRVVIPDLDNGQNLSDEQKEAVAAAAAEAAAPREPTKT